MILFNNNPVTFIPIDKNVFEYGNEIVWLNGNFLEIFKIIKIIKQLHKEGTIQNDYLVVQSLCFKNYFLIEIISFILKRCDIRIFSLVDLSYKLPYTKCNLERLLDESYD